MKKTLSLVLALMMVLSVFLVLSASASGPADYGYVEDGLVAFYDARIHSEDGKTWTDASGKGNDIDLSSYDAEKNHFTETAFLNTETKINLGDNINTAMSSNAWTTEIVLGSTESTATSFVTYLNCPNDAYSFFFRLSGHVEVKLAPHPNGDRPKVAMEFAKFSNATFAVTFDVAAGKTVLYYNGEKIDERPISQALATNGMFFGWNSENGTKFHTTEYKALRFYDKALTAEQVKANYDADVANKDAIGTDPVDPGDSTTPAEPQVGDLVNMAKDKTYTIAGGSPRASADSWADDGIKLTNGDKGLADPSNAGTLGMHGNNVDIIVDLGAVTKLSKLTTALPHSAWGIPAADKRVVEFFISENGVDYTSVGKVQGADAAVIGEVVSGDTHWIVSEFALAMNGQARYVKVNYSSPDLDETCHLWITEIEALKTVEASGDDTQPATGDAGMIALAVVAVIALGGAAAACKRK